MFRDAKVGDRVWDLETEFDKLELRQFVKDNDNYYLVWDKIKSKWTFTFQYYYENLTTLYFKDLYDLFDFTDLLNEHKITPEQLRPLMLEKLNEVYGG